MSNVQHILVCAQDSVLAKKVRFLLARDECEVEILSKPSQLERRLQDGNVQLLILSRSLDGEDAIEMLARFDPSLLIPPTIVLGGQPTITADFISVIPDPIDTQAIYRIASEALAYQVVSQETAAIGDEDMTHLGFERPAALTQPASPPQLPPPASTNIDARRGRDEDISFTDVTGLDEIAGRLDLLESADAMLNDAFDVDESDPGEDVAASLSVPNNPRGRNMPRAELRAEPPPPILGGLLEPARFAKVLYQCWAKQVTGALIVARDHETLTVHFENGSPIHVESSIPGDQLGRALVARGRITEAQYSDGAKRAIERGLHLGQALIDLAFFTQTELGKELGTNARDQIVGCFAARQGAFEFDAKRRAPTEDRPYAIPMGHVIAEGIRKHCDEPVLKEIVGDIDPKYFKLLRPVEDLVKRFPLDAKELSVMEFSGRAYNVADAAEVAGMSLIDAHKLMALLMTCEESQDFTPGVREFEARISEERQRSRDLEAKAKVEEPPPKPVVTPPPPPPPEDRKLPPLPPRPPPAGGGRSFSTERSDDVSMSVSGVSSLPGPRKPLFESSPPPPPQMAPPPLPPPSTSSSLSAVPAPSQPNGTEVVVPPMPVPPNGEGMVPRPLVYAKPLPRGADGTPLETQERTLSREHFQRGVTLLGQGNFASAEEAFRDAVALCSEEHVYLIGLARAIYYNPGYRAEGKVPVLKAIVGRAEQLAPEDNRVATLSQWIAAAESQIRH